LWNLSGGESVVELKLAVRGVAATACAGDPPLAALGGDERQAAVAYAYAWWMTGDDDVAADVAAGSVGVNPRGGKVERGVPVDEFVSRLRAEVDSRS